jgi:hypothetical protein
LTSVRKASSKSLPDGNESNEDKDNETFEKG